jgi:hypothetical protein
MIDLRTAWRKAQAEISLVISTADDLPISLTLTVTRTAAITSWTASGFRPFVFEITTNNGERRYEIVELLTAQEMQDEGGPRLSRWLTT